MILGRIYAIGGGELRFKETMAIDKIIVESVSSKTPKLLFIPTASSDAVKYIESIKEVYGELLGCEVETLLLAEKPESDQVIKQKILGADIIYVGGGNTKLMMQVWRQHKVDIYLKEAYDKGTVMSGLSAGSICWFDKGHSDSDTYVAGKKMPYSMVDGLGIIPLIHCPHHDEDNRAEDFDEKMYDLEGVGLALENNCAIEIMDDSFRILTSNEHAKAYKVMMRDGKLIKETLDNESYEDIKLLYC